MKSAIGYVYVRYSRSYELRKSEAGRQQSVITDYCAKNGYRVTDWIIEVMESHRHHSRVRFESLLNEDLPDPAAEAVIIADQDIFYEDSRLFYYYAACFEERGLKLISASADPEKEDQEKIREYRSLVQFIAEQERKRLIWKTRLSRKEKANHGGYSGGRPPFGYRVNNNHALVVMEEEAETVRKIFCMRDTENKSFREIAEKLNELGCPNIKGGAWNLASVKVICDNRKRYQGYSKYGQSSDWVKGEHEAIIGEDE